MNETIRDQLAQLGSSLGVLQQRVRQVVAGEIGDAVANALAEIITQTLAGRREDPDEPMDEFECEETPEVPRSSPWAEALFTMAVVGGRSLLSKRASPWTILGMGLSAGLAVCSGNPLARTLLGILLSFDRLRTGTEMLRDGAKSLNLKSTF